MATADVGISLLLSGAPASVGAQGYQLDITATSITVRANQPAGLFNGVQTLRQLLPVAAESTTVQTGPWLVPGGQIVDHPRFGYRGAMLDVARHFFPVAAIKAYIDQIALYKVNHLHLHLSDDQGWRIAIDSWPRLTTYGGGTSVGGGPGGYYTKADYTEIVNYAAIRHITIVPEIDMPGHTNAALASYAELNCNGEAPSLYTGMKVGFSSLCVGRELTYKFIDDVIRELAALTPGPYIHIGGDEASSTSDADYAHVHQPGAGDRCGAWQNRHRVARGAQRHRLPSTVAQFWWKATAAHCGRSRRGFPGYQDNHVAGQQDLSGHEVQQLHRARAEVGRADRRADRLRVEPGRASDRGGRVGGAGRGGSNVERDHPHLQRHRVHGVPAPARPDGTRLVTREQPQLGGVPATPCRAGPALAGHGGGLLSLAADRLAYPLAL